MKDRQPSRHDYYMGGKYQLFWMHVEKCFVNQIKNGNTLTQQIIAKQPQVTTVAGPQTSSFRNIKRKITAKTTT